MLEKKPLAVDSTVPTISALILMDNEGKRIAVDYFAEKLYVYFFVESSWNEAEQIPFERVEITPRQVSVVLV